MTSVKINPADPTHPVLKTEIRPIRVNDYKKFFSGTTEEQIRRWKVVGVENVEVVHDPTLKARMPEPIKGPVKFIEKSDEEKIAEARIAELEHREATSPAAIAAKAKAASRTRKAKA